MSEVQQCVCKGEGTIAVWAREWMVDEVCPVCKLREQVRKLTEERDKARDDADVRQGQILALREQADRDRSELTSAKQDAEEQAQLADGLMKDLSSAKQQIEELTRERDEALKRLETIVWQKEDWETRYHRDNSRLAARIAELEKEREAWLEYRESTKDAFFKENSEKEAAQSEAARLREDGAIVDWLGAGGNQAWQLAWKNWNGKFRDACRAAMSERDGE